MLLNNFESGGVLHRPERIPEAEVGKFYKALPKFNNVIESQFVTRLKDLGRRPPNIFIQALSRKNSDWPETDDCIHNAITQ
jgi:hypothetical protein